MTGFHRVPEQELRALLGRIAAEHQPDRAAMLRRIGRHRAGSPVAERPPAGNALRLAGSALAVVTILGVGGVARWSLADGPGPGLDPVAPPAAPSSAPARSSPPSLAPSPPSPDRPAPSVAASRAPRAGPPAAPPKPPPDTTVEPRRKAEPVLADGSVTTDDTVGRSEVTVTVREPLSALTVTVRVAQAADLNDQGGTHDAGDAPFGITVVRAQETLVYRFKLADGTRLTSGTYVFTAKYADPGEGGRDAGADTYQVTGTTASDPAGVSLTGGF